MQASRWTSLTFLGVNYTIMKPMQPFLVSAALIAVALYVRFNIDETRLRERADENRLGPAETLIAQVLRGSER